MSLSAGAQITLRQSDFTSWTPGTDTFRSIVSPLPAPSTGMSLDLSTATYAPGSFQMSKVAYSGTVTGGSYTGNSYYKYFNPFVCIPYGVWHQQHQHCALW